MSTNNNYTPVFDWAIVELFGHNRIVGKVGEQQIGGETFIRVDVPDADGVAGFTKLYGKGAIYAMTPTTEQLALAAIKATKPMPIQPWELRLSLPSQTVISDEDDYDEEAF
jgi:hypothetical protein